MKVVLMEVPDLDERVTARLIPLLSPQKRDKVRKLADKGKIAQTLWAELLARSVACASLGVTGSEIEFGAQENGKPFLLHYADFHFNVSHSGSRILLTAGSDAVGVDIERVRPIDPDVSRLWFSSLEQTHLAQSPPEERAEQFYAIWTLKESYAKAAGLGFCLDPRSYTVIPEGEQGARLIAECPFPCRFFRRYRFEDGYRAAVCSSKNSFPDRVSRTDFKEVLASLEAAYIET